MSRLEFERSIEAKFRERREKLSERVAISQKKRWETIAGDNLPTLLGDFEKAMQIASSESGDLRDCALEVLHYFWKSEEDPNYTNLLVRICSEPNAPSRFCAIALLRMVKGHVNISRAISCLRLLVSTDCDPEILSLSQRSIDFLLNPVARETHLIRRGVIERSENQTYTSNSPGEPVGIAGRRLASREELAAVLAFDKELGLGLMKNNAAEFRAAITEKIKEIQSWVLHSVLARIHLQNQDYVSCINECTTAIGLNASAISPLSLRATALLAIGDVRRSQLDFEMLAAMGHDFP